MVRGLYTAASGMINEQRRLDVISNNLANVNTTGYKKDIYTSTPFKDMYIARINDKSGISNILGIAGKAPQIGTLDPGISVSGVYVDFTSNGCEQTGNKLDCAISGDGFFTVQANTNNRQGTFYTRDGSFDIDSSGTLVTKEGYTVMGENGPIKLNPNLPINIRANGEIIQNGQMVDKLKVTSFQDMQQLRKSGDNLYLATAQAQAAQFTGEVKQGYLESSNVNTIKEMVSMINVMRTFEANQKTIKAEDDLLSKAVNEVGAVR